MSYQEEMWELYSPDAQEVDCVKPVVKNIPLTAQEILEEAIHILKERGKLRDSTKEDGSQERSMELAVRIFNAYKNGKQDSFTELDGWYFMLYLKIARSSGGKHHPDDGLDLVGYAALIAECMGKEALKSSV